MNISHKKSNNFIPITYKLTNFEKILLKLEQIRYIERKDSFFKETAFLKNVDGNISYYFQFSQILSNKFNRGSGYLTHGFDFYRGSFHGQMIRALINYCNLDQDSWILDPFSGSGTTLIEAKLLGFNSIGIDINPIACLNSKIKTELLNVPFNHIFTDYRKYFNFEYYNSIINHQKEFNDFLNQDIKELFFIFLFTRAISMQKRFNINKKLGFTRNFNKIRNILKKFEELKNDLNLKFGDCKIIFGDSIEELKNFESNFFDAIITSPPYLNLIDYIEEDYWQIKYLVGKDKIKELKYNSIGNWREEQNFLVKNYWDKINQIMENLYRLLKPKKKLILIIGNYGNMRNNYKNIALNNDFKIERILQRKVVNLKRKDNVEYVLFLKK